eukprot:4386497-Amphidinium_carterae.1
MAEEPEPEQLVLERVVPDDSDPFDRDDAEDDPYHLGMLHEWDASWSIEWSSATPSTAEPGSVACGVKAQPGPQQPGRAMQSKGGDGAAKAMDAVHEVEWNGQRWIAIHHASTRQDTFQVSKLKRAWNIAEAAPVYVDGCTMTGEFNMSYTVDTDPHSIGMDWWGTTYVQIDAASPVAQSAEPRVKAQPGRGEAVVPSGEAYAL